MTVVLDLDGVVWLADRPIPGAADAVGRLRAGGHRVVFVTNNSFSPVTDVEQKLAGFGIPAAGDVLTSAVAAARLVKHGERVFLCAGPGAAEAVAAAGGRAVTDGDADAVVVGFHTSFDYDELRRACTAVRRGARLIGTNDDHTYPTPGRADPGRRRHPGGGGGRLGRGRRWWRGSPTSRWPTSCAPSSATIWPAP